MHDKHIYNRTTGPVGQRLYYTAAASDPPTPLLAPVNTSKKRSWAERDRKQKKGAKYAGQVTGEQQRISAALSLTEQLRAELTACLRSNKRKSHSGTMRDLNVSQCICREGLWKLYI